MNITCLDIETTGLDKSVDRIVQLSLQNFDSVTFELGESRNWYILPTGRWTMNPEAKDVHKITEEFLEDNGDCLRDIYPDWCKLTKDHVILSYNGLKFDIPMIQKEFEREGMDTGFEECKFIDALDLERKLNKHNNNKLGEVYERYFGHPFEGAHDASADILATIEVYKKQVESLVESPDRFKIWEDSVSKITDCIHTSPDGFVYRDESGQLKFRWGKHKDELVVETYKKDPDYMWWIMHKKISCSTTRKTMGKEFQSTKLC